MPKQHAFIKAEGLYLPQVVPMKGGMVQKEGSVV